MLALTIIAFKIFQKKKITYFILYTKLIIDINYLIRFRLKLTNDCGFVIFNLIHELFERWSLSIIFYTVQAGVYE